MKFLKNRLHLLRRPVTAVILPPATCALFIVIAWFSYLAPTVSQTEMNAEKILSQLKQVEKQIREQRQYHKQIALIGAKQAYTSSLDVQNAHHANLLGQVLDKSGLAGDIQKITHDREFVVYFNKPKPAAFYELIETLEQDNYIDRAALGRLDNGTSWLNITLNDLAGVKQ